MGTIGVHEFVSLDGVFENPAWTAPYGFPEGLARSIGALTASSSAILLGRRTFEMFAPAWSTRTRRGRPRCAVLQRHPQARGVRHARLRRRVAELDRARRPTTPRPSPGSRPRSTAASTSAAAARSCARCWPTGWSTSCTCVVYPLVLGSGARLFPDGMPQTPLALTAHEAYDNGVLHLTYGPAA